MRARKYDVLGKRRSQVPWWRLVQYCFFSSFSLCAPFVWCVAFVWCATGHCQSSVGPLSSQASDLQSSELTQRVAELIERLGDPSFQRRASAEWALQEIGLAAFEQLRTAALEHPDIQVAKAAAYLIQSQDVIWFLETDSIDVRGILNEYDALDESARIDRVKMLAELATEDAVLALCRLARFERHERVSKEAALGLYAFLSEAVEIRSQLLASIEASLGVGDRPALQWIRQALSDLEDPRGADVDAWKQLAEQELSFPRSDDRGRDTQLVLDFFARCGVWIKLRVGSDAALDVVAPSVQLLDQDPKRIAEYSGQVLDEWKLPELLPRIAELNPDLFTRNAELGYFLAEAQLQLGNPVLAESTALAASNVISEPPERVKALSRDNDIRMAELIASNRRNEALRLNRRGMFPWAEREYIRALEQGAERFDSIIRVEFAEFYWLGGENAKAAGVLEKLVQKIEASEQGQMQELEDNEKRSPQSIQQLMRESENRSVKGAYYFYQGLAYEDAERPAAAHESLVKSLQEQPDNPDILIAMRRVSGSAEAREFYDDAFVNMRGRFRRLVVRAEEGLARAQDRDQRRRLEFDLAQSCNQLAWLLGKCESDAEEAIRLSERSLELMPDEPAFLDTLGRCYFSAGRVEDAVRVQRRAVELSPYERLMVAQLREFERELDQR
ncbi:MAG: hypothetical protein NXI32_14725 [bacterium]|nr:hypothetical protein [bacterium]